MISRLINIFGKAKFCTAIIHPGRICEIDGVNLLDFEKYKEGRRLGKIQMNMRCYTYDEKYQTMAKLVKALKDQQPLPNEARIIGSENLEQIFQDIKYYQLTSLNFRTDGNQIPDHPFIFIMAGEK